MRLGLLNGSCWPVMFLLAVPIVAKADLIRDGGFESANPSCYTMFDGPILQRPDYTPGPWIVTQGLTCILTGGGPFAHTGTNSADMGGSLGFNHLTQTISTIPGQSYAISFWLSDPVGGNTFSVELGTVAVFDGVTPHTGTGVWAPFTLAVMADASNTDLTFIAKNTQSAPGLGRILLDDVSVTASVPEPATALLSIVAWGVLGVFLRSRRLRALSQHRSWMK